MKKKTKQKTAEHTNPGPVDTSFEFRDMVSIPKSTGKKAKDLRQFREGIASVSDECIFHHTCQYFSRGHIQEYTNDFAQWASVDLEEGALSEHLSNIDPYAFASIQDLRNELLGVIDRYLEDFPEPRAVLPGSEFFFCEAINFVFPAGLRARNLAEFFMALKYIDTSSIYYHFYEARVRLGKRVDDFSTWVEEVVGEADMAEKIRAIDPFMHTMEGIREHLAEIIEQGLRKEMEVPE